jgi:ADP-ribosylglycohydrolase
MKKEKSSQQARLESIQGCLLGTATGDALGLPFEGMSPQRIKKLNPLPLRHRFFFNRGMLSDDTEHTCLVAQSLLVSGDDSQLFVKQLARRLRWWLLGLPAGIGMATLKSLIKLSFGVSPEKSGVWSAGNGPAMRSAIIGVYAGKNNELLTSLVTKSTLITHSDPKALKGALIVAKLAAENAIAKEINIKSCLEKIKPIVGDDDILAELIDKAVASASKNESAKEFCQTLGFNNGVSGYIYQTLPVVLQIWLRHPRDYETAMQEAILCGGDTDTVAAILGGMVGAGCGVDGIPKQWIDGIIEWPRSVSWMNELALRLAKAKTGNEKQKPLVINLFGILLRNAFFMVWVLLHGFRRLLPPY